MVGFTFLALLILLAVVVCYTPNGTALNECELLYSASINMGDEREHSLAFFLLVTCASLFVQFLPFVTFSLLF
jgi:hypothetical protein